MEPEEGTPLWRLQKLPPEQGARFLELYNHRDRMRGDEIRGKSWDVFMAHTHTVLLRQCVELLHKVIDGICGRAYPVHQDYHGVWNEAEWKHVLEDVTTFFKAVVGKNFSDEETLQQLNQLNSSHQEAVMKCLKSRKNEIKQALLGEIVEISCAQLQDFDWQLKLALSSDKIATLQMPLLNLHLDVKENGAVKPYSVEMSKEELQNLISSLEAANKVVLQLK